MQFLDSLFSVAQFVLETTFKTSILALIILLIQLPLRKKTPAKWLHALWLLLIIRMLIPFEFESKISVFNLISVKNSQELIDESFVSPIETPTGFETIYTNESQLPVTEPNLPEASKHVINFLPIHYFTIFWLLGMMILLKITLTNNLTFSKKIKGQQSITNKEILDLFHRCKKEMKVKSKIGLVEVETVQVPLLYGILRPRILLPNNFVNGTNSQDLEHILLHELAHFRRRDIFVSLLTTYLQIVHWFNPIVWFAFFRMRIDRELATDEKTLSLIGSEKSRSYGQTIISMLKQISTDFRSPVTVGIVENKKDLKRRIAMISNFKKRSVVWTFTALMIIIGLAFFTLTKAQNLKPLVTEISIKIVGSGKVKLKDEIVSIDSLKHKLEAFHFDEKSVISIVPDENVNMGDYFKIQTQLQTVDCKNIKYINTKSGKSFTTSQYDYRKLHRVLAYDPLGLQPVKINNKFGYKNKQEEIIVEPKYDQASHFEGGLAIVRIGEKWGAINNKGETLIEMKFNKLHSFWNGMTEFEINKKWGFIDTTGKIVIPAKYENVYPFLEDLAQVKLKNKWGYINKNGDFEIAAQFEKCKGFHEGVAAVFENDKWGFINKSGELVIDYKFDDVNSFSDGLALVRENGKYGYINKTGNFVIKPQYKHADVFSEGLAAVKINGKYGYIDIAGNIIIDPQYDFVFNFMLGSARVTIFANPESGIMGQSFTIDKAGNVIKGISKNRDSKLTQSTKSQTNYKNDEGNKFNLPIKIGRIVSRYGKRIDPFTDIATVHNGIDIAAKLGTQVYSAAEGVLITTEKEYTNNKGKGKRIIIKHKNGFETIYAHLLRINPFIKPGQKIKPGQRIGYVGDTGRAFGTHLHFEIRKDGKSQNPEDYIDFKKIRREFFELPIKDYRIISTFGWRTDPITKKRVFHNGIDYAAPKGKEVFAAAEGILRIAPKDTTIDNSPGRLIIIDHKNGFQTAYFHLDTVSVSENQKVHTNQLIGRVGINKKMKWYSLHFEVRLDGKPLSPKDYFDFGNRGGIIK